MGRFRTPTSQISSRIDPELPDRGQRNLSVAETYACAPMLSCPNAETSSMMSIYFTDCYGSYFLQKNSAGNDNYTSIAAKLIELTLKDFLC